MTGETRKKLRPFILTAVIIVVDQAVKALIVATIPLNTVGFSVFSGFLRIIHARNLGIAFSIGGGAPGGFRGVFFMVLPLVVLALLVVFYFRSNELTALQRWSIAGILGGGLGNLIDRLFRPLGVVDFIDVKFYGLFGLDRWPTFNIADASVVVCGLLLLFSVLIQSGKGRNE